MRFLLSYCYFCRIDTLSPSDLKHVFLLLIVFQNQFWRTSSYKSWLIPGRHHTRSFRENTLNVLASNICQMRQCCKIANFVYHNYHEQDRTVPPVWPVTERLTGIFFEIVWCNFPFLADFLLDFISVLAVYYTLIYYVCSCSRLTKSFCTECNKPPSQSKLGDWMCFRGNIKLRLSHCLMVRVNLTPRCTALISGIKTIISYAPATSHFWSLPPPPHLGDSTLSLSHSPPSPKHK